MARKRVTKELSIERKEASTPTGVVHVTLSEATKLITVDWPWENLPKLLGAIVRIRMTKPDDGTLQPALDGLRATARKVTVIPFREKDVVTQKSMKRIASATAREVVMALVDASVTENKEGLRTVVETVMGEAGL